MTRLSIEKLYFGRILRMFLFMPNFNLFLEVYRVLKAVIGHYSLKYRVYAQKIRIFRV